jgi:EmrB/QacA subfamily drug resistance transporter
VADLLRYGTPAARPALAATILASGMAFLDGSVVTVALPRIEADLGGGFATMQWVTDAYLLTLGSLVLIGGALGDLLGRRRVFLWGIAGFGVTSVLCGLAPTAGTLVVARTLQGAAAALMVPASLAILSSVFAGPDRGRAIGLWSGLSGITTAVGPVVGGFLVDLGTAGWRAVFLLNVPLAILSVWLARRGIPEIPGTRSPGPLRSQVDILGGVLAVTGLALLVGSLIEAYRIGPVLALLGAATGIALLVAFIAVERRRSETQRPPAMMPPDLFRIRSFAVANVQTFVVYAALSGVLLLFTVTIQIGLGWSALAAGAAGLPITLILALGSSRAGGLLPVLGARAMLTAGPAVMAVGIAVLATVRPGATYLVPMLPGLVIFSLGLTLVVAPITTTALGDIPEQQSGVGSGINNAVARIAGLVAIAAVPLAAGFDTTSATDDLFAAYSWAQLLCAGLCLSGAVVAWFGFRPDTGRVRQAA